MRRKNKVNLIKSVVLGWRGYRELMGAESSPT